MKIIAVNKWGVGLYNRAEPHSFLVEVTREELLKLANQHYCPPGSAPRWDPQIGDEVNIALMYGRMVGLQRDREKLATTAEQLRNIATLIETFDPVVRTAGDDIDKMSNA